MTCSWRYNSTITQHDNVTHSNYSAACIVTIGRHGCILKTLHTGVQQEGLFYMFAEVQKYLTTSHLHTTVTKKLSLLVAFGTIFIAPCHQKKTKQNTKCQLCLKKVGWTEALTTGEKKENLLKEVTKTTLNLYKERETSKYANVLFFARFLIWWNNLIHTPYLVLLEPQHRQRLKSCHYWIKHLCIYLFSTQRVGYYTGWLTKGKHSHKQ